MLLPIAINACAPAAHHDKSWFNDMFTGDPVTYLVGEWEGTANVPGDKTRPERILIIYPEQTGLTLRARYGAPEIGVPPTTVYVRHDNGKVGISFLSGGVRGGSTAELWLQRIGNDLVLTGTLHTKTSGLRNEMFLKKRATPAVGTESEADRMLVQELVDGSPWEGSCGGQLEGGVIVSFAVVEDSLKGELISLTGRTYAPPGPLQSLEVKNGKVTFRLSTGSDNEVRLVDGKLLGTWSGRFRGWITLSPSKK